MPEIFPFRALRYAARDVTRLVTQPYDRVSDALQREYLERDPHNFIRIDKPLRDPGRQGTVYEQAAATLREWTQKGILVRDPRPALYATYQFYGGKVRKGLSALVRIGDRIHAHEETHAGPKADRLEMIKATRAHISPVFLLYSDPQKTVNRILDEAAAWPSMLKATDDFGERHEVWLIDDPHAIATIRGVLATSEAIIADGHHRTETATNYRNLMRAEGARCEGPESFENVLATLVNMDDELTIFGTHRVIRGLPSVDLSRVGEFFEIREPSDIRAALETERARPAFGLVEPNRPPRLLVVRDTAKAASQVKADQSPEWRSLDVNILHTVILEGMLGITPHHTAQEMYVGYLRSADEAIDRVRAGKAQVAFLVNPVRMEQIRTIVAKGERFPQKSTDFYPKLLSGLLACSMEFVTVGR
ncbi:MAG: DUF1015 domain-containing protein [Planctomycetes bacterium]|nr:DUF1015 domain-containing protein [Planctomycetota bacterium]